MTAGEREARDREAREWREYQRLMRDDPAFRRHVERSRYAVLVYSRAAKAGLDTRRPLAELEADLAAIAADAAPRERARVRVLACLRARVRERARAELCRRVAPGRRARRGGVCLAVDDASGGVTPTRGPDGRGSGRHTLARCGVIVT